MWLFHQRSVSYAPMWSEVVAASQSGYAMQSNKCGRRHPSGNHPITRLFADRISQVSVLALKR